MKELAILVDNKNDSTEAQDLLFSMGYKWRGLGEISKSYFYPKMNKYFIFMNKNEMDLQMAGYFAGSSRSYAESRFKEITLPELRDIVVLKRNDVGDATHEDYTGLKHLLLKNTRHVWGGDKWLISSADFSKLKPIEKQMKEYLIKSGDGKYLLTHHDSIGAIEIPEGCNIITCEERKCGLVYFHWKSLDSDEFFLKDEKIWSNNFNETLSDFVKKNEGEVKIIWSRYTHPEELPFIDDEPKIETATGYQLDVVGSNTYGSRSRYDGESDISYRQYLMNFIVGNRTESLNDQYAEIEKVRQTLNQRQSQYGSFEDVAMITEQMVDVMRKGYYENLAYNQKMALYMICSKMARIVNGNPNHKDSWHDIAGYATLIDNELESEKDMPF